MVDDLIYQLRDEVLLTDTEESVLWEVGIRNSEELLGLTLNFPNLGHVGLLDLPKISNFAIRNNSVQVVRSAQSIAQSPPVSLEEQIIRQVLQQPRNHIYLIQEVPNRVYHQVSYPAERSTLD